MQKIKISILGCGWLGLPLTETLIKENFTVNGSTTSQNKLPILENSGINPFLIELHADSVNGNITGFLDQSDILIINIPPKLRGSQQENFTSKIKVIIPFIENSSIRKILFISSTSVYSDDLEIITEQTIPEPATESGRQLLSAEQLLSANPHFKTTVLRFGGLIGNDRNPVYFLSGKQNLNADAPVNLIHIDDCIAIIVRIIKKNIWNETFNAVTPFHPSREKYYTEKAASLNLELPTFNGPTSSKGKIIDATKLIQCLDYKFYKPQL